MSKEIEKSAKSGIISTSNKLDKTGLGFKGLKYSLTKVSSSRLFYQYVAFVIDGTGSMTWDGKTGKTKGEEVQDIIVKILDRLGQGKNKEAFDIGVYGFAEKHKTIIPITKLSELNYKKINLNPTFYFQENYNYEDLDDTLDLINRESSAYLAEHKEKSCQVLVIILSDGAIFKFDSALEKVSNMKKNEKITFSSILLEDLRWDDDEEFKDEVRENLKKLSSTEKDGHDFFMSNIDPDVIRKHMIKSISTISKID